MEEEDFFRSGGKGKSSPAFLNELEGNWFRLEGENQFTLRCDPGFLGAPGSVDNDQFPASVNRGS